MSQYDDIIHMDRPHSKRRKMSRSDRAAQFAPFAALTGYEEEVSETARLTDERLIPDEEAYKLLDEKLEVIRKNIKRELEITVLYFVKDLRKKGGTYLYKTGIVRKINEDKRTIEFMDKENIPIDDIFSITLPDEYEDRF
ncbi:MAG: hypothetical protein Q4D13_07630 [Erysipelotrichaceae bacterium]|nr:hypothetical protein [Erysipelotrichaceae bacterium]